MCPCDTAWVTCAARWHYAALTFAGTKSVAHKARLRFMAVRLEEEVEHGERERALGPQSFI